MFQLQNSTDQLKRALDFGTKIAQRFGGGRGASCKLSYQILRLYSHNLFQQKNLLINDLNIYKMVFKKILIIRRQFIVNMKYFF